MAAALIRTACPQNAALLIDFERASLEPWPTTGKKFAVYIVHEEKNHVAYTKAEEIRDWLVAHTDLSPNQIPVQEDMQNGRDRALMDVKPSDLAEISRDT
eukprot:SAG22_NODE_11704_length_473_cov_0.724599_1_plen_99_part_10